MPADCFGLDADLLSQIPLFSGLRFDSVKQIASVGSVVSYTRATRVLNRGDVLDGFYVVFQGHLKLFMLSCDGAERVLRVLEPGNSFGEAMMFNGFPSPVFVESLSTTELAYFPGEKVSKILTADADLSAAMLRSMSALLRELIHDLEACCLMNARQRTIAYLLRVAETDGQPQSQVHLPATKWIVASTLDLSAETFSRELHRLQDEGLIQIDRRTIYFRNRTGLIEAIGGNTPMIEPDQR
jgi:CRP-like cAMP-binding protein